jgi:putative phosphoesterase
MLVGLISDTHDNLVMVERAVKRFNELQVELVLHAGDYIAPFVVPKFEALNCRLVGVFGNNDGDHAFLRKRFNETDNCEVRGRFAEVDAEGFKIALLHGDEADLLNALVNRNCFDALVYGHVHEITNITNPKMLVVNPGEACGYLTGKATVALLDTVKRKVRIIEL